MFNIKTSLIFDPYIIVLSIITNDMVPRLVLWANYVQSMSTHIWLEDIEVYRLKIVFRKHTHTHRVVVPCLNTRILMWIIQSGRLILSVMLQKWNNNKLCFLFLFWNFYFFLKILILLLLRSFTKCSTAILNPSLHLILFWSLS